MSQKPTLLKRSIWDVFSTCCLLAALGMISGGRSQFHDDDTFGIDGAPRNLEWPWPYDWSDDRN